MNPAITLGPLVLPWGLGAVLASLLVAWALGRWLGRRQGADPGDALWGAFWAGALLARIAFIVEYRSAYLAEPLSMLDIRDGGWNPVAGLLGAWLYALVRARRRAPQAWPALRSALMAGTAVFVAGLGALSALPDTDRHLPALTVRSLQGAEVDLRTFQGKPTVINLWATWCPPCVREMPVLAAAQRQSPDVNVVFLNQGEAADQVRAWLRSRGLGLDNALIDETRAAGAVFEQKAFPTTLFFDADGRLVGTRIGELSAATLQERLARIRR